MLRYNTTLRKLVANRDSTNAYFTYNLHKMTNVNQAIFYTMSEVADRLKVSRQFVNAAVREGKLKSHRLGTQVIRISEKQLQQFLKDSIA